MSSMFRLKRSEKITTGRSRLRTFNNFLTAGVISLSFYIITLPFIPHFQLWWTEFNDKTSGVQYGGELAKLSGVDSDGLAEAPEENTLVVPGIQVNEEVLEGGDISVIGDGGVWRRPKTSTPDQGGNTVFVAHRFSYSDPSTFYHLDKVETGDVFATWWEGKEYIYKVSEVSTVAATTIEIEDNTDEPILTLYTCTPVWTAVNRLVIKADLVNTDVLAENASSDQTHNLSLGDSL